MNQAPPPSTPRPAPLPLYVDMDGTLLHSDTLHESLLALARQRPLDVPAALGWLGQGKAGFKRRVADRVVPDPATLAWNRPFLDWLRAERARGRPLVLATAADVRIARAVAQHCGDLFDEVLASNDGAADHNLGREAKRDRIAAHAASRGWSSWAYAGNGAADLPIWSSAAEAVAVGAPHAVARELARSHPQAQHFAAPAAGPRIWWRALRLTQWAKNALLFLPLLAAHRTDGPAWALALIAFLAFGLVASATYLVNDLLDLPNDRQHEHKQHRPLAAGRIGVPSALGAGGLLLLGGFALGAWVSAAFVAMLTLYALVTLAYSLALKRVALMDVLVLSALYTLRIVAGAVAVDVALSNWLLAISVFLFLSLALVKRCAELEERKSADESHAPGRGYVTADLPTLRATGVASGFAAVLVLALYIESPHVLTLYAQPQWLWGAVPLLLLWLMRMWLVAGRRGLHGEDPLQFALHDRASWAVLLLLAGLGLMATTGGI